MQADLKLSPTTPLQRRGDSVGTLADGDERVLATKRV